MSSQIPYTSTPMPAEIQINCIGVSPFSINLREPKYKTPNIRVSAIAIASTPVSIFQKQFCSNGHYNTQETQYPYEKYGGY